MSCMYFMEFKVEVYEYFICYVVKVILNIYSIVIYVNVVIFFQNYVLMFMLS